MAPPTHTLTWHPTQGWGCRHDHDDTPAAGTGWWGYEIGDDEHARLRAHAQLLVLGYTTPDLPGYAGDAVAASWADTDWTDPAATVDAWYTDGDEHWEIDGHSYTYGDGSFYRIENWCTLTGLGESMSIAESLEGAELDGDPIDVAVITGWSCDEGYIAVTSVAPVPSIVDDMGERAEVYRTGWQAGHTASARDLNVAELRNELRQVLSGANAALDGWTNEGRANADRVIEVLTRRGILPAEATT